MRKQLMVFGIVLFFLGSIMAGFADRQAMRTTPYEKTALNAWEISGDFAEGDNIYLVTVPGINWSWWAEDPPLDPDTGEPLPLGLNVTITDPYNAEAKFKVFYESPPPGTEYPVRPGDEGLPIFLSKIELADAGSLVVKDPPDGIGGAVNHNGTYVARVIQEWWMWGPAERLVLHREVFTKEYAYTFLLPVGGAVCILGVALAVLGAKSSKPKMKARPKRKR